MGFFDRFKSKHIVDDTFGKLSYTTFRDPLSNFYDGMVDFHNERAGVVIYADEKGPTGLQKEFFRQLKNDYPAMKENIIVPFLKIRLRSDFNEDCQIVDFDKEFALDGITIPRLPQTPVEWSICYDSVKLRHWVTIQFSDLQPLDIMVDG